MIRRLAAPRRRRPVLVLAVPAMAGGWAEVGADAQTTTNRREGEPIVVGFTVLQHSETPAPWVTPTVRLTDTSTGDDPRRRPTKRARTATSTATATVPEPATGAGSVILPEPRRATTCRVTFAVYTASGTAPPFDPATAVTAIDRRRRT